MIPVSKPWITDLEKRYVNEALSSGWISSNGPFINRFEEKFAAYVGTKHAISTSNGTAACHVCLDACGVKPGHRVAVPAMTFVATANAVA
jgi:perosamine synthetase